GPVGLPGHGADQEADVTGPSLLGGHLHQAEVLRHLGGVESTGGGGQHRQQLGGGGDLQGVVAVGLGQEERAGQEIEGGGVIAQQISRGNDLEGRNDLCRATRSEERRVGKQ